MTIAPSAAVVVVQAPNAAFVGLRCQGCGAGVDAYEGGYCAWCRMTARGDGQLLAHDDRGWQGRDDDRRIACRCGHETFVPSTLKEGTMPEQTLDRDTAIEILTTCGTLLELRAALISEFEISSAELVEAELAETERRAA